MKVLVAHSVYRQRGGEDVVVESEIALLRSRGIEVDTWYRHNTDLEQEPPWRVATQTAWSTRTVDEIGERIQAFRPDVIHVHNTFPAMSPSVFWAASRAGVPIVLTLHNFRLLCLDATFLREGRICESCYGRSLAGGVRHGCFNDSVAQSAVVAVAATLHRRIGTWQSRVTRFIALNRFCRDRFAGAGFPVERFRIKPNFVEDSIGVARTGRGSGGGYFVGRLSEEKGFGLLASVADRLPADAIRIIGDGPLAPQARAAFGERWLGALPSAQVMERLRLARWAVIPSICYEQFPRVIVEAFACGVPVIASRLGSLPELVEDGVTGLLFEPGNAQDLAAKVRWAEEHPDAMRRFGDAAREVYLQRYTAQRNFDELTAIYRDAIGAAAAKTVSEPA